MDKINELLKRKAIFHCRPRGAPSGKGDHKDFDVIHTLSEPLNSPLPDWATPTLLSIYEKWNGLELFQPAKDEEDGFRLFSVEDCAQELNELREILEENFEECEMESEYEHLEEWLDGLIPIAEIMSSGNKFALDTFRKNDSGEAPIVFLDHEVYYGGACDPDDLEIVADNAVELLQKVLTNPLDYVASHWTGPEKRQWYPEAVTFA